MHPKPEYLYQPLRALQKALGIRRQYDLWGLALCTFAHDYMTRALHRTGVYDLAVTELLHRLCRQASIMVDAGANIGYMSRTMALSAPAGSVLYSFEPNPEALALLEANRQLSPVRCTWHIEAAALTQQACVLHLHLPAAYAHNKGTSYVSTTKQGYAVQGIALDDFFGKHTIDVLKIDVEGHELALLEGAIRLLTEGRIRHILFEDFAAWPSPVAQLLVRHGYTVLALRKGWWGMQLHSPEAAPRLPSWEEPNFVATLEPAYLAQCFSTGGYACLRGIPAR